ESWSFKETLRHLVFVTDSWIARIMLERPSPHEPMGLPPDFVTDADELGIDTDAAPTLEEVLAARATRVPFVRDVLAGIDVAELDRPCSAFDGRFTVLGTIQVVIFEEWAHHQYITRDLAVLTSR